MVSGGIHQHPDSQTRSGWWGAVVVFFVMSAKRPQDAEKRLRLAAGRGRVRSRSDWKWRTLSAGRDSRGSTTYQQIRRPSEPIKHWQIARSVWSPRPMPGTEFTANQVPARAAIARAIHQRVAVASGR